MCKAIEEMRNQEREEVTREFVVRMIRDGETSVEKWHVIPACLWMR